MVERVPGLPKTSGERNNVEGKTERKSKLVTVETSVNLTLKESKAMAYLLLILNILLTRLNDHFHSV